MNREIIIGVSVFLVTTAIILLGQFALSLSGTFAKASIINSLSKDSAFIRAVELELLNDQNLEDKLIEKLQEDLGAKMFPENTILAFGLIECPSGWESYTPSYGKFLRGIDPTGQYDTKDRVAGDFQSDAIQGHAHSINPVVSNAHGPADKAPHGFQNGPFKLVETETTDVISLSGFGEARVANETRPKNVSVLYCQRVAG